MRESSKTVTIQVLIDHDIIDTRYSLVLCRVNCREKVPSVAATASVVLLPLLHRAFSTFLFFYIFSSMEPAYVKTNMKRQLCPFHFNTDLSTSAYLVLFILCETNEHASSNKSFL